MKERAGLLDVIMRLEVRAGAVEKLNGLSEREFERLLPPLELFGRELKADGIDLLLVFLRF